MNKFSQPIQSNFVPTYAPVNIDAIAQSAQAMQTRQDQALAQRDSLYNTVTQAMGSVAEGDKPIIEDYFNEVEGRLSQYEDSGDWFRAGRDVKSLVLDTNKFLTAGKGAKAIQNMQNMTENTRYINEEWDAPDHIKRQLKNNMYSSYKNVDESGTVQKFGSLPDYVNEMDLAHDYAKEVQEETTEFITKDVYVRGDDGEIGVMTNSEGVKVKETKRDRNRVTQAVAQRLYNNDEFISYATREAEILGIDPEEHIRSKVTKATSAAILSMGPGDRTFTGGGGSGSTSIYDANSKTMSQPGQLIDEHIIPKEGFNDYLLGLEESFYDQDNPQAFQSKLGGLQMVTAEMVQKGELEPSERDAFLNDLEKGNFEAIDDRTYNSAIFGENRSISDVRETGSSVKSNVGEGFSKAYDKIKKYVDNQEGVVTNAFQFTEDRDVQAVEKSFLSVVSPASFEIMASDLDESEEMDKINELRTKSAGQVQIIPTYSDDGLYYNVSFENKDGEPETMMLREKVQANQNGWNDSFSSKVAERAGGTLGKMLNLRFGTKDINFFSEESDTPMANQPDIISQLPHTIKPQGIEEMRMQPVEGGVTISMKGGRKQELSPYTNDDYLQDSFKLMKDTGDSSAFTRALNKLASDGTITQKQKDYMLQEGVLTRSIYNNSKINNPYIFPEPRTGLNYFIQ